MGQTSREAIIKRLAQGEQIKFLGVPCYKFKLGADTIRHDIYKKLRDEHIIIRTGKDTWGLASHNGRL